MGITSQISLTNSAWARYLHGVRERGENLFRLIDGERPRRQELKRRWVRDTVKSSRLPTATNRPSV